MRGIRYALFALSVWLAIPAMATTYYASPTGTAAAGTCTSNTCTGTACCSLSNCIASVTVNGDVCSISGTFDSPGTFSLARDCASGAQCTLTATTPGTKMDPNSYSAIIDIRSDSDRFNVTGDYWVVNGIRFRKWAVPGPTPGNTGISMLVTADRGFSFTNNRVELAPGIDSDVIYINGPWRDVLIRGNWWGHYPGCINGGEVYTSPWTGLSVTAPSCGGNARCDFDTSNGSSRVISFTGHTNTDNSPATPATNVVVEQNYYGYNENGIMIRNTTGTIVQRNFCININNHGCWENSDNVNILFQNNIATTDTSTACLDEVQTGGTFDSYCFNGAIYRNNTIIGHGRGLQNAGAWMAPNAGADACDDAPNYLPEMGATMANGSWYNNIYHDTRQRNDFAFYQLNTAAISGNFYTRNNLLGRPSYVASSSGSALCANPSGGFYYCGVAVCQSGAGCSYDALTFQATSLGSDGTTEEIGSLNYTTSPASTVNAFFVDAAGNNFHPASGTVPIVNAGIGNTTFLCPAEDFDGNPRNDGACDIGAFEFQGGGGSPSRDLTVSDCSTETGLENAIAAINVLTPGSPASITFTCPAGTVIPITATRYANRQITLPQVTVNGGGTVAFEMNPKWWDLDPPGPDVSLCSAGDCDLNGDGIPEQCPTVNDGTTNMWVMRAQAANITFKNFTYRYFVEGLRMEGANWVVDNVVGEYPGDENLSNPVTYNGTVQNSTFRNACDKNIQMYGDEAVGSANYDMIVLNNRFYNSSSALRTSGVGVCQGGTASGTSCPTTGICPGTGAVCNPGRFYVEGNTFESSSPPASIFTDRGPYFGDDGGGVASVVYWKGNTVHLTNRGVRVSGATQFISLGGNTYDDNDLRGLSVFSTARAAVFNDIFTNNGGSATGGDPIQGYGGIAVGQTAIVDAGSATGITLDGATRSTGGNVFTGNHSSTDTTLDFHNLTATTMSATNNCWTSNTTPGPSDSITGSVTFSPIGACGSSNPQSTLRGFRISGGSVH